MDFSSFVIDEGPEIGVGNCSTDTLWISGASNYAPGNGPLCGDLTGQHSKLSWDCELLWQILILHDRSRKNTILYSLVYLDYGINDKIHVDVYLDNLKKKSNWDIQVTMIKCNSDQLGK